MGARYGATRARLDARVARPYARTALPIGHRRVLKGGGGSCRLLTSPEPPSRRPLPSLAGTIPSFLPYSPRRRPRPRRAGSSSSFVTPFLLPPLVGAQSSLEPSSLRLLPRRCQESTQVIIKLWISEKRETAQDLQIVMGALYAACLFLGVNNASTIQPVISIERTVFYRERASKMYSSFPYAAAQGIVEIPYILTQTIIFGGITYFMINYERSLGKFLLYLLFNFLTFTYFTFYGMMAVGLTPSQQLAAVISSAFYSLWNLLSGFLVPNPNIPSWWIWFYHICPVAWTLRGIITSQLGDVETRLVGAGFDGTVKQYLEQTLGFESGMTGITVLVLIGFSVLFFSVYAISIKVLNFQRR